RGWPDVPEWVFCSETGDLLDESNVGRVWRRLRRRAQKKGVRPLKLHSARHTWATLALGAGKSPRWVADQLGHSNPSFTMNVYSHALPREEHDLSFVDFGATQDQQRTKTSQNNEGPYDAIANPSKKLVELGGIEPPTLRLPA
ncbi:MAG: tyrosine-type recombinase/integrase, partial [Myxococcales bacterium]|nr:tyrosine-type recombinase/integrase [Myxococcales bacterium]